MNTPTAQNVRPLSDYLAGRYPPGDPDPDETADAALEALIEEAAPLVMALTSRRFDDIEVSGDSPLGCPWEDIPAWQAPTARRALVALIEAMAFGSTSRRRRADLGGVRLRSFTAGPYSETYFGPDEASKARVLHPDPAVHAALWAIATECARQAWLRLWGQRVAPASAVQSFDYRRVPRAY